MRSRYIRLLPRWLVICVLLLCVSTLVTAQHYQKFPPESGTKLFLPGSPLDMLMATTALQPPLVYETSISHTRPEKANLNRAVGAPYLR